MTATPIAFVLGYNQPENSIACLETLGRQSIPLRLVYFDNGSAPENAATVREAFPDIDHVRLEENQGFAFGWNTAMAHCLHSGADWVLAANNDLEFADDFAEQILAATERYPDCGMVTPKIYYHDQPKRIWSAGLRQRGFPPAIIHLKTKGPEQGEFDSESLVDSMTLCTALIRADAACKIGLLDPSFFFYCEDTDYSERMKRADYSLLYAPEAKVWHKSPIIGENRNKREDMWFHLGRSEAIFCRKHPHVYPLVKGWIHRMFLQARTLAEGGGEGFRAFRRGFHEGQQAELLPVPTATRDRNTL